MGRNDHIDDAAIEALLSGNGAGDELTPLAAFAGELRSLANGPAPVPSAELAAMLAHGFTPHGGAPAVATSDGGRRSRPAGPRERRPSALSRYVAGLGLAVKAALSTTLAVAGVTAAGAAGALPGPAQRVVSTAVEAVTPFEFPRGADEAGARPESGGRVSTDAGGFDGRRVSEDAEDGIGGGGGGDGRPEAPGRAGLDRAGESPAAGRPPASVPGGRTEGVGPPAEAPPAAGGGRGHPADPPAVGPVPTAPPAVPLPSLPSPAPVAGGVTDATPTLPPLPDTVPATVSTTVPRPIPPPGGPNR